MINRLHLHNFKCFEDQSLPLRSLTLLTGLNSTGKSSVLQSLLLLRQSYQEQVLETTGLMLKGNLVNIGVGKDVLFEGAKDPEIGISIDLQSPFDSALWRFQCDLEADVLEQIVQPSMFHEPIYNSSLFNDNFHVTLQSERYASKDLKREMIPITGDANLRSERELCTDADVRSRVGASPPSAVRERLRLVALNADWYER